MDPHLIIAAASNAFRWPSSRRKIYLRRRKPQVVRLGGKNSTPRGRFSLKRVVTRMRLKWLKLYYVRLVKNIKAYYSTVVKEFEDAGATTIQQRQRKTVETAAFAAPGLGLSFCHMSCHEQPRLFLV